MSESIETEILKFDELLISTTYNDDFVVFLILLISFALAIRPELVYLVVQFRMFYGEFYCISTKIQTRYVSDSYRAGIDHIDAEKCD